MDELNNPELTIKVVGHQWYWSYEYGDCFGEYGKDSKTGPELAYIARMIQEEDLLEGRPRLLQTDFTVLFPARVHTRLLVTSADVLHSWSVPSLGIKIDACPGRLNRVPLYALRVGSYYGQCSELCGIHHGFMPIFVRSVNYSDFLNTFRLRIWAGLLNRNL
jgi:cytochrome c oxidase subunit 2